MGKIIQANIFIGVTLILGLGSVVFALYLLNNNQQADQTDRVADNKKHTDTNVAESASDESIQLENLVAEIQSGLGDMRDNKQKYEKILRALCMKIDASQGIIYSVEKEKNKKYIEMFASFAFNLAESQTIRYEMGEGLAGQVAKEGKKLSISDVPEGYITIISGLGASSPKHLIIVPIKMKGEVTFVVEIASFKPLTEFDEQLIKNAMTLTEVKTAPKRKKSSQQLVEDQKEEQVK